MRLLLTALTVFAFVPCLAYGQWHPEKPAQYHELPPLREQARLFNEWKDERIARIPALLKKYDIDAWLLSMREHNEDPLWWSLKNATQFAPHRRTVLLFHTNTSSLAGHPNPLVWVDNTGAVWDELRWILVQYAPQRIALNTDRHIAFGGGLAVGEWMELYEQLPQEWMKAVNQPMLAVEYIAARVPGQLSYYRKMQETVWAMIQEAFSARVIEPNITTTVDVEWWFREKIQTQNFSTWVHPRVSVITPQSFPGWAGTEDIIQEGDLLHVDFGVTAMSMNTDTQHMAYVLRTSEGESDAPEGHKEGIKKANRMQDIVLSQMQAGKTGNAVLQASLRQMKAENISGQIYCHPIGDYAHAPGAVMGFTNLPEYVPVLGELPILPNTWYSIELYAYHLVPERNETLRFRLEETVHWVDDQVGWKFVHGRQEALHLIDWQVPSSDGDFFVQS
ncbi:hypothetical protein GLOTRDRAFT_33917 [Gloeophyllum trabeum ATCC 11539]|uniref:Peptidase M24 domain-containing protein n=1 Tax=Gloeophyllum trabeum (strain ATCC 11539 / FP-39264 / Madison 617) TaxID=670483 RepID=S7QIL6_GLOTA|nr:uncharacterized protein GLOTRDRAFT_33917 [Gloeophyllum trabeum ATCC 11539]EPQ59127.1 hypothetical protein GLOTRDRAFT_33917 [Gloeophyllum trabeum ATCC 11539]